MMLLRAVAILLFASSPAMAASRIPSSDLPGRERYRFVDPPAAGLLQPSAPNTVLPYGTRASDVGCRARVHGKLRKRCRPTR